MLDNLFDKPKISTISGTIERISLCGQQDPSSYMLLVENVQGCFWVNYSHKQNPSVSHIALAEVGDRVSFEAESSGRIYVNTFKNITLEARDAKLAAGARRA
jgi:hypothetical protein